MTIKNQDFVLIDFVARVKEVNQEYTVEISPEEGFGKKDPKLIRIIPSRIFKEKNINPFPGLQVNIDNIIGTIRSVSSGRIIIDFNHPLAGKNLIYQIKIIKKIETNQEKTSALLEPHLKDYEIELKDTELTIKTKNNIHKEV